MTRRHIVGYLIALLGVSVMLGREDVGGPAYLVSAIVLGIAFLALGAWGLRPSSGAAWARKLFFGSMIYLVLLLAALMVGA